MAKKVVKKVSGKIVSTKEPFNNFIRGAAPAKKAVAKKKMGGKTKC